MGPIEVSRNYILHDIHTIIFNGREEKENCLQFPSFEGCKLTSLKNLNKSRTVNLVNEF